MADSKKYIKKNVKINPETDFTTRKLVEFLNGKYTTKKTGEPFKLGDVQQYLRRGHLPRKYGFHPMKQIEAEDTGIILIRVDFNKTYK